MTTPKEITATEKLLDLIRTSSLPPTTETTVRQETEPDCYSGLCLEEISFDDENAEHTQSHLLTPVEASIPSHSVPPRINNDDTDDFSLTPRVVVIEDPPLPSSIETTKPRSFFQSSAAAIVNGMQRLRPLTKTTIAVDIQPGVIHLVKTKSSKQGQTLLACQSVPYQDDLDVKSKNLFDDPPFRALLFTALSSMVDTHVHYEIWCSYAYCNPVGLHNISIPKVGEKEIANAVFWSAKRELEFDEHNYIFDYSILQEYTEGNQVKIQTLVTLVPRTEVQGVEAMFRNAGFPLTGLTFPVAAIQNFLNQDDRIPADKPVVYFTIRKHNSFIDIFHHGKMLFSREIKTGTESFVESLLDQALSRNILIDEENAKDYLFRSNDSTKKIGQGSAEIFSLLSFDELSVIDRLVRQLMRTFEYCTTTFKTPPACQIFTSGECTVNETILKAIENRVGIKCAVLEPFSHRIFSRDIETSAATGIGPGLLVAAGLSLSNKQSTANFLYTYADRFEEIAVNRLNTIIAIVTICLTIGSGMFFALQYNLWLNQKKTIETLRTELDHKYQAEPRSRSKDYTTQTIQKISQFHRDNKQKIERFKVVVMINELTKKIGNEISITDMVLELERKPNELRIKKDEPSQGVVRLTGYIRAPLETQEFILMNFLKTLASLSLLGEPNLKSKENTTLQNQDVLRFEINLKTILGFLETPSA